MPHLRFRGVHRAWLVQEAPALIKELAPICQSEVGDFTVEFVGADYLSVLPHDALNAEAFVEVFWFKRSNEIQSQVASCIDRLLKKSQELKCRTVVFIEYKPSAYYENGIAFS